MQSVYSIDANTGYAVGDFGTIIKTINGGTTWSVLLSGIIHCLWSVYFPDGNTGNAVGEIILNTIDGGIRWSDILSGIYGKHSVFFTGAYTDFVVGSGRSISITI